MSSFNRRTAIALGLFPLIALALLNGLYVEHLYRTDPFLFWAADVTHFIVLPLGVVLLLRFIGVSPQDYGFRRLPSSLTALEATALVLFISFVFWAAYEPVSVIAYRYLWQHAGSFGYGAVRPSQPGLRLLGVIYLASTAAFVEEAVFRGLPWLYLQHYPQLRMRVPLYVACTSVLFAAIHSEQGPHGVLAAFSLGLVLAMLYPKVQSLWPFVFGHFLADVSFW